MMRGAISTEKMEQETKKKGVGKMVSMMPRMIFIVGIIVWIGFILATYVTDLIAPIFGIFGPLAIIVSYLAFAMILGFVIWMAFRVVRPF